MSLVLLLSLLACTDKNDDSGGGGADGGGTDGGGADGGGTDGGGTDGGGGDGGGTSYESTVGCEARHDAVIAALEAELADSDAPGVTMAILEDGVVTCQAARGTRGADSTEPATVHTLFQIGSVTKMFTSLAMLQQVEDGVYGLDDNLATIYPDSEFALDAGWNDAVTVQHLLTHQGAFYDYIDVFASSDDADLADWHDEEFFRGIFLMAEPGSFFNYSNPNFDVAGLVVEHHDGRWYPDLMKEGVFAPLGMTRTMQRKSEVVADGDFAEGVGYIYESLSSATYGPVPIDEVVDPAHARPAGVSTWTTPDQLVLMGRFLMEGDPTVLGDGLRTAMTSPQVEVDLAPLFPFLAWDHYGYGIAVSPGFALTETEYYDLPIWSHGGNTNSYSADFYMIPDQGFAIAILNSSYGKAFDATVATALATLVDLPTPRTPPALVFEPKLIDRHLGHYEDPWNVGPMDVTRDGDHLVVSMPLLETYEVPYEPVLEPITTDIWAIQIEGAWYDLTFKAPIAGEQSQWAFNRYFALTRDETGLRSGPLGSGSRPPQLPRGPRFGPAPRLPGLGVAAP